MHAVVLLIRLVASLVAVSLIYRAGLALDAAWKKANDDPDWAKFLPKGKIEDMVRE